MSENQKKTTKKKATKKKATKKKTTSQKEEIPAPLGSTAPELSERGETETTPTVEKPVKNVQNPKVSKQPPYNKAFQVVCQIPGISSKQKSQVKSAMEQNWGKNKTHFIEAVVSIGGLKQKRGAIEKALEGLL